MNSKQKITIRIESSFMEIIRKEDQVRKTFIQSVINRLIHEGIYTEMYNKDTFNRINEIRKRSEKGNNIDLVKENRRLMR
ncbi:hypothetical protein M1145_02045 [Patescibacteria group bacterium]|nr:hypothetical protein [Patescibacteria group bacterium]